MPPNQWYPGRRPNAGPPSPKDIAEQMALDASASAGHLRRIEFLLTAILIVLVLILGVGLAHLL